MKLKTQKDIEKFLLDNNYRFSTVYLYKIIKELGLKFDSPELMVREYICFLKNQYGSYFVNIQRFLALLSRLDSPVTIREFESLLGVEILRVRDLSIINDLKYFLFTLRTYQGSVILPVELICTQELLEETEKIWEEDVLPNWLVIVDDFYEKVNSTDYSSSQITEMDQFRIPYILDALSFGISKTEPPSWFQKGVLCLSRLVQDSDFATSSRTFSLTLNYFNYWMENISSVDIYTREYLIVLFSSVLNPAIEFNQWDLVWYLHSKVDLILQTFSALEMNRHNNKVARAGYNAHMSIVWGIIGNEEQAKSSAQVALDLDKDTGGLLNSQVRNNLANILRISNPEEALAILGDIPTEAQEKQDPFSSANNYFIRGNIEFMTHHLNDCIKLLGKAEEMIKYCNFQKPIVKELSARITMTRLKCEAEMPVQIGWFDNAIISLNKLVGLIHKEVENGYLKFSLLKIHIVEMTAEMYFRRCGLSQGKNISDLYSAIETIEVAIVLSQKLDVRNTEHRGTIANLIFNKGLYIWKTNDINTAKEYFKIAIEMLDSGNPSEATIRKYYSDYLKQNLGFSMG